MRKLHYFYSYIYSSGCRLSKIVRAHGEPYEISFWWLSLLAIGNLGSIGLILKYFFKFKFDPQYKIITSVAVAVISLTCHYYLFLRRKKYKEIIKSFSDVSSLPMIYYMLFTLILLMTMAFIND